MTELRFAVEFPHPAARVWRALTQPANLGGWFAPCRAARGSLGEGGTFTFWLHGLVDGPIEGEVVRADPPYRLAMRWRAVTLRARVTWELCRTPAGCRLDIRQSGFLGLPAAEWRERWLAALADRFAGALPAVLEALAALPEAGQQPVPRQPRAQNPARFDRLSPRGVGHFAAIAAVQQWARGGSRGESRVPRQRSAHMEMGGISSVFRQTPPRTPPSADPNKPPPVPSAGPPEPPAQAGTPPPGPAQPGPGAAPSPALSTASRPRLTATYTVERTGLIGLTGYRVTIRIDNPGAVPVPDWTTTFTLRRGQKVESASGAEPAQEGRILTLTPGSAISPHGSVTISFDVSGLLAGEPNGCTIDGRPCG